MPSISDIPTDWTGVSSLSRKFERALLGGATVKDVVSTTVTTTTNTVTFGGGGGGKNVWGFSASVSALQVAALLSGAATGAIIAYYGTDKSLDKAKEFAIAFKKKAHLFDLWLKDIIFDVVWPSLVKTRLNLSRRKPGKCSCTRKHSPRRRLQ